MPWQAFFSDGSWALATHYVPGDDGFIECVFPDGDKLATEIPNAHISSDGNSIARPEVATLAPKKRPAARAAANKADDKDNDNDDDEADEKLPAKETPAPRAKKKQQATRRLDPDLTRARWTGCQRKRYLLQM